MPPSFPANVWSGHDIDIRLFMKKNSKETLRVANTQINPSCKRLHSIGIDHVEAYIPEETQSSSACTPLEGRPFLRVASLASLNFLPSLFHFNLDSEINSTVFIFSKRLTRNGRL